MSHWIAVSWNKNQLLLLSAKTKKGKTFFEKALRILPDLNAEPAGSEKPRSGAQKSESQPPVDEGFTPEMVKAKLRHFVQQERLGKCDTVVVVERGDVEVRSMIFPPVPNDEIPEMARFQAAKEFTEYDPSAALDFVLFDGARKDKKHILAATLTKSKRDTIEGVVTGAGLDLQRIVLGPCESAKRFAAITVQQRTGGAGKTTLLVEMGESSATLVLLYRGMPAFVRTANFQNPVWASLDQADKKRFESADELANWRWLTDEFKRTIIAAINDVPSEKIDEIVLCGTGERYEKLVRLLEESLAVPVSLFNVWRFENREGEIANHLPVYEEQFLPLIGALSAALVEKPNALDFKNPKRKPEKKSKRHLVTIAIALVLVLVFALGTWGGLRRMALDAELKDLIARENSLKEDAAKTERLKLQYDSINAWQKSDINWLEQLEWLSNSIPSDEDVILSSGLMLRAPVNANQTIEFTALTRGSTVAPKLEQNLRDETHTVRSPKAEPSQDPMYTQKRELTVTILPPKEQPKPLAKAPATPEATTASTATPPTIATETKAVTPETATPATTAAETKAATPATATPPTNTTGTVAATATPPANTTETKAVTPETEPPQTQGPPEPEKVDDSPDSRSVDDASVDDDSADNDLVDDGSADDDSDQTNDDDDTDNNTEESETSNENGGVQ